MREAEYNSASQGVYSWTHGVVMKRIFCLALALGLAGCTTRQHAPTPTPTPTPSLDSRAGPATRLELPPQITSFIAAKEKHAQTLAVKLKVQVHDDYWRFFREASRGDWPAANSIYESLQERTRSGQGSTNDPKFNPTVWQTIAEVSMVLDYYTPSNNAPKWSTEFGEGIVKSIPRGSIYFGGTDPGRGLPTAFSRSHAGGDPFYTLTQNALADGTYLEYLRHTYGGKIQIPSNDDSQQCFQAYLADAQERLQHDKDFPDEALQLKPGEDVQIVDGKAQASGQVAVMAINGLLTKVIFDRNPDREFYVEESFPLEWMYAHLTPHGLIMKVHREPLASLAPEIIAKDREFWTKQQAAMIGDWLTPDTSVREVCEFAEKVFLKKDLSGFQGDPSFVRSDHTTSTYSKLRSSIAGIYNWRIEHSDSSEEKQRMIEEADFAFRQAFALCPVSPEAIFRYANLLVQNRRVSDALRIAYTADRLKPEDPQIENLIVELERIRDSPPK